MPRISQLILFLYIDILSRIEKIKVDLKDTNLTGTGGVHLSKTMISFGCANTFSLKRLTCTLEIKY